MTFWIENGLFYSRTEVAFSLRGHTKLWGGTVGHTIADESALPYSRKPRCQLCYLQPLHDACGAGVNMSSGSRDRLPPPSCEQVLSLGLGLVLRQVLRQDGVAVGAARGTLQREQAQRAAMLGERRSTDSALPH